MDAVLSRVQQAKREEQLAALQKAMEAKEATWQRLNGGQGKISQIKARFDQELAHLQAQRDELQAERSQLIRVCLKIVLSNSKSQLQKTRFQVPRTLTP